MKKDDKKEEKQLYYCLGKRRMCDMATENGHCGIAACKYKKYERKWKN